MVQSYINALKTNVSSPQIAPDTVTEEVTVPGATIPVTVTVTESSRESPVTETFPAGVRVRHSGTITLTKASSTADLDATDPKWTPLGDPFDLSLGNGLEVNFGDNTSSFEVADTVPTYEYCRDASKYDTHGFFYPQNDPKGWRCVKTSGNRFATLHILSQDDTRTQLQVTVYDPPTT